MPSRAAEAWCRAESNCRCRARGSTSGPPWPAACRYQAWASEAVKRNVASSSKDDPHGLCLPDTFVRAYGLPHIVKFVQTPRLLVALEEYNAMYRQILLDGRPLPDDPNPTWNGYSVGRWEGDTLVVDSIGFRDDLWLDFRGSPLTSAGKVRERITRPDFGHLNIEVTVDDPKVYTRPWTVTLRQQIIVDTEINEEVCLRTRSSCGGRAGRRSLTLSTGARGIATWRACSPYRSSPRGTCTRTRQRRRASP